MFSSILTALISKALPAAADFFLEKERLKQEVELEELRGKPAWERAMTHRAEASEGRDHEWEIARLADARTSWKDEWVLLLLSVPLILVFIPNTQQYVLDGFTVLAQTPEWYQWMIGVIFTAIYGVRVWRRK